MGFCAGLLHERIFISNRRLRLRGSSKTVLVQYAREDPSPSRPWENERYDEQQLQDDEKLQDQRKLNNEQLEERDQPK